MKKILITVCCFSLSLLIANSALGMTTPPSSTDRKLNELAKRFSTMESSWGRFQMGGNFKLDTISTLSKSLNTLPPPSFNQQLGLFFNAYVDQNLQLSLNVSQLGGWGVVAAPMTMPFQVDEAFLRLSYPDSFYYLGRFRFSLGPLGLVSNFFTDPVEGLAIQKTFNNFQAVAIYSRTYTEYIPNTTTNQIQLTDDYLSARVGWSNQTTTIGLNLVPKGRVGEKAFSFDWSTSTPNTKIAAELGWYSFNSSQLVVGWRPGILVSYGKTLKKNNFLQLKAGYFPPDFAPSYSSLANSSRDNQDWFIANSQGIELFMQTNLKKGYGLENRLMLLSQVETNQPELNYRWRSSMVKNFSPVNQLQVGIDLKSFPENYSYNQIFVSWFLQF